MLNTLRHYVAADEAQAPAALHARTARLREETETEALARLTEPGSIETFRRYQEAARARTILVEDHNFYIDQRGFAALRRPMLAIGARLVKQGTVDRAEDVFYLYSAEIEAAVDATVRYQAAVSDRRADRERWMRRLPPPVYRGR